MKKVTCVTFLLLMAVLGINAQTTTTGGTGETIALSQATAVARTVRAACYVTRAGNWEVAETKVKWISYQTMTIKLDPLAGLDEITDAVCGTLRSRRLRIAYSSAVVSNARVIVRFNKPVSPVAMRRVGNAVVAALKRDKLATSAEVTEYSSVRRKTSVRVMRRKKA